MGKQFKMHLVQFCHFCGQLVTKCAVLAKEQIRDRLFPKYGVIKLNN